MKITQKLVSGFISISLLTGIVGAVAIAQTQKIAENLAIAEAENVAQAIGTAISDNLQYSEKSSLIKTSERLQNQIKLLHEEQQRDIEIVNLDKKIVADVFPEDIGSTFEHDRGNQVRQTMQDGKPRTFLEQSVDYPQGIQLIVIPIKFNRDKIVGAIILEYSSLYNETITKTRPTMTIIAITSVACIILALLLGLRISSSIANPLKSLTNMALQVTQTANFNEEFPVKNNDEIGTLGKAFNNLIQRVQTLLNEKEQRSEELQQALNQLHNTQLQLVQTEKMSSLGQLVAGVAHEINNPVNFIHGNINHIDRYTQDLLKLVQAYQNHYPHPPQTLQNILNDVELNFMNEDLIKLMKSMKIGTDRIRQIVLSLRNFSRLDEAEFKAVDIHEGIENTLLILKHRLDARPRFSPIEVVKNYGVLPLIECYPGQLNQTFMNLLVNAIDSLEELALQQQENGRQPASGKIWISTQVTANNRVQIAISDNGVGISEPVRSQIFNPFFTTKSIGKGTGLGLSISYQIVTEKHQGKISCFSTPGEETKFIIEIPICQSALVLN
jgi:signal transduction histidine kinase